MNKIKMQKGITLIALIITIVVLLVIGVVAVRVTIGTNGIITRAQQTKFLSDVGKYKEELELYKSTNKIEEYLNNRNEINTISTWEYESIKGCIKSFSKRYEGKIGLIGGKLAYRATGNNKEKEWAEQLGIVIQEEEATITIETQGLGKVSSSVEIEEGEIAAKVGQEITIIATKDSVEQGEEKAESIFKGWYSNGALVSNSPSYTFKVAGNETLTAIFETDATLIYYLDESGEEKVKVDTSTTLSGYTGDKTITRVEVGKNCTSIAAKAFKESSITTIIADTTNTLTINEAAFHLCANLTNAIFTNVNLSGSLSFAACNSLIELQLGSKGKGVSNLGFESILKHSFNEKLIVKVYLADTSLRLVTSTTNATIYYYDEQENLIEAIWGLYYSGDKSIENVEIPDVTTEIRPSAFLNCEKLKLTKLPKNLKKIGDSAFENCTRIEITQIPSACTSIGKAAFKNSGITEITANTTNTLTINESAFHLCANLTNAIFTNVNLSGSLSFAACNSLIELQLGSKGKGVQNLGFESILKHSFNEKLIVKVYLADTSLKLSTGGSNATIYYYDEQENLIEAIWGLYYSGDKSIENVEIPDVTTEIRPSAFLNCEKLKLTKLPTNLKKIGKNAFENCTSIEITQIPNLCTSIEEKAFANCVGITNITANTTNRLELGAYVFSGCTNLTEAKFYNVKVGDVLFHNCKNLTDVQLGKLGVGISNIEATNILNECKKSDLIVKVYLTDTNKRLSVWNTNATIHYYDEQENLIEKKVYGQ